MWPFIPNYGFFKVNIIFSFSNNHIYWTVCQQLACQTKGCPNLALGSVAKPFAMPHTGEKLPGWVSCCGTDTAQQPHFYTGALLLHQTSRGITPWQSQLSWQCCLVEMGPFPRMKPPRSRIHGVISEATARVNARVKHVRCNSRLTILHDANAARFLQTD